MKLIANNNFYDDHLDTSSIPEKAKVVQFFNSVEPGQAVAGGFFDDLVTGETIRKPWRSYASGDYAWTSSEVYHFEKYDLELKPEFIKYVLSLQE